MEMSNCSIWLRDWLLRNGNWCLCDDVRREAVKAGYARRELKEARKVLGVKTFTSGKMARKRKIGFGIWR